MDALATLPVLTSASTRPACAFFDVDNTLIRGASGFHLAKELYRRRFFRRRDIAWFAGQAIAFFLRGEDVQRVAAVRSRALGVIRGRTEAEIVEIGEEVYEQVLDSRIFPGARALVSAHLEAGHQVWLVTATPREIGELMARRLGATGAVATVAETRDGVYTGELVGDLMHGSRKAEAVRQLAERAGADLKDCAAYGDSVNDLEMLQSVGFPCAINPEPHLRVHALEERWPVRDFRRRRSGLTSGAVVAGAGAGLWGLVVLVRRFARG
ncbi:HAD-IB family hydrolase [Serinibacter arcticus]|uniref:HAD-IB family hydrolase n=1 Tax=Serinibacter arcticus TaxID=1655435 RepID=A0A2U1ZUC2_9MICO|nr:HAD-IB family hydrolase [Serinibacter arcticus]PWD50571.1 HAD-IB family hydrolase [Serinibacter arcticus]